MKRRHKSLLPLSILLFCYAGTLNAQQLAFPTAEGYGKYTVGGRGGKVYEVTTLADGGPGSLRAALGSEGPRTIVFRVGGNIELKSGLSVPSNTTIAGQTAPGDGICLKGQYLGIKGEQIIVRYIRVRLGDQSGGDDDAISGGGKDLIFDHISTGWSIDEIFSVYGTERTTIQWCMITEALNNSHHKKGAHGYGGIWGGSTTTHHHNLFAHNSSRNPRFSGHSDYRNNVVYNWGINTAYGGSGKKINMVANYCKPGPATKGDLRFRIVEPYGGEWFVKDNYVFENPQVTADNWDGGVQGGKGSKLDAPVEFEPINQQTAEQAYESVLEHVGCSFPKRDALDARIIQEVREGKATHGADGIINSQKEVGGWPALKSGEAPADGDHDGMPDEWEKKNGLNPADAEDRNAKGADGYTNLEIYLNSLVARKKDVVGLKKEPALSDIQLSHNFKNPSNSLINIQYAFQEKSRIKLEVLDLKGRGVAVLVDGVKEAGKYVADFNTSNLKAGLYTYRLTTSNRSLSKKMVIIR